MRFAIASALLTVAGAAGAEEAPICAARPGKATPPCTVPAGRFQLEAGVADWAVTKDSGVRATSLVLGETTFKVGLTSRSDLEVDVTPWQRAKVEAEGADESHSGFGDIGVAYKHRLTRDGAALQVAALPSAKIPTDDHFLGNRKVEIE